MRLNIPGLFAALASAPLACADVATFESFSEGYCTTVVIDGGIEFCNLDRRLLGDAVPAPFAIENAHNMLWRDPAFTAPNALGFGTYSPGIPVTFSRLGSFEIVPSRLSARASVEVFEYGENTGYTINLTAFRNGQVVGEHSVPTAAGYDLHHYTLLFEGTRTLFDRLRVSIGPMPGAYIFALVDTVRIDAPLCDADWNASTELDSQVMFDFLTSFFADQADFNHDGTTNSQDFFEFLTAFFAGC